MKNKTFFKITFIYFTAMTLVACLFVLGYLGVFKSDVLSTCLIQLVVMFGVPLLLYTLLVTKNTKQTFKDAGFKKIGFISVLISIALGFVLYFINSFVANSFSSILSLMGFESISSSTITLDYATILKEFIFSALLPGFCEEFLHRGILLHAGKKCGNTRYVLIISSILFGLMHLNIGQFFYAAILGLLIGFVGLKSDSIFPCMIIHFMNNFLSTYFFYGYYLNWPLAVFVNNVRAALYANPVMFIFATILFVVLLSLLYIYLVKLLTREHIKREVKQFLQALKLENLSLEEAQEKVNQANIIMKEIGDMRPSALSHKTKFGFKDNIFVISSCVLGALVTILSFVWGII